MKRAVLKHRLAVRWFHWINVPLLAVMVWSGLRIYWANDVYRLGWGDTTILKFFPDSVYEILDLPFHLAEGMAWHFTFMWLFAVNGALYVCYLAFSGEWRSLAPDHQTPVDAWRVLLHDLHLRREIPPQGKYNAAQRLTYTVVVLMGFGSVLTGVAIYKPVQLRWLCAGLGSYEWARAEHFALALGFVLFLLVHMTQVVRAGWNNFQGMVTGFDVLHEAPGQPVSQLAGTTSAQSNAADSPSAVGAADEPSTPDADKRPEEEGDSGAGNERERNVPGNIEDDARVS